MSEKTNWFQAFHNGRCIRVNWRNPMTENSQEQQQQDDAGAEHGDFVAHKPLDYPSPITGRPLWADRWHFALIDSDIHHAV
jgi:hypothetical protein